MRLIALFLIASAALPLPQAINPPGAPTDAPNQVTVTTSYLYYNKLHYAGTWSSTTSYNSQDLVIYSSLPYISLATENLNNIPSSSPLLWFPIPNSGGSGGATGPAGPTGPPGTLGPLVGKSTSYSITCADFAANGQFYASTSTTTFTLAATSCAANGIVNVFPDPGNAAAFTLTGTTAQGQSTLTTLPACSGTAGCAGYRIEVDPLSTTNYKVYTIQGAAGASGSNGAAGATGATGATGGGSVTAPAGTPLAPYGTDINAGTTTGPVITSGHQLVCEVFALPQPMVLNVVNSFVLTGTGNFAFGFYQGGSLLVQTATVTAPGEVLISAALTGAPITLTPSASNPTSLCYTSTATSDALFSPTGNGSANFGSLNNQGLATPNLILYRCANASTGTSTVTMPATCGTETAISTANGSPSFLFTAR